MLPLLLRCDGKCGCHVFSFFTLLVPLVRYRYMSTRYMRIPFYDVRMQIEFLKSGGLKNISKDTVQ